MKIKPINSSVIAVASAMELSDRTGFSDSFMAVVKCAGEDQKESSLAEKRHNYWSCRNESP